MLHIYRIVGYMFIITASVFASELEHTKNACASGVAAACFQLGLLYEQGIGVPIDKEKAKLFFVRSCDNGFDTACLRLEQKECKK
jgi:TPR repeat protein